MFDLVLIVFDWQVLEFRGPASTTPAPTAVGASVALDKVCAAMASMEEPVSLQAYAHTHARTVLIFIIIYNEGAADRFSTLMMPFCPRLCHF